METLPKCQVSPLNPSLPSNGTASPSMPSLDNPHNVPNANLDTYTPGWMDNVDHEEPSDNMSDIILDDSDDEVPLVRKKKPTKQKAVIQVARDAGKKSTAEPTKKKKKTKNLLQRQLFIRYIGQLQSGLTKTQKDDANTFLVDSITTLTNIIRRVSQGVRITHNDLQIAIMIHCGWKQGTKYDQLAQEQVSRMEKTFHEKGGRRSLQSRANLTLSPSRVYKIIQLHRQAKMFGRGAKVIVTSYVEQLLIDFLTGKTLDI